VLLLLSNSVIYNMNKKISEILVVGLLSLACVLLGAISLIFCVQIAWFSGPGLTGNLITYFKIVLIGFIGAFFSGISTFIRPRLMILWISCSGSVFFLFAVSTGNIHWVVSTAIIFFLCFIAGKIAIQIKVRFKKYRTDGRVDCTPH
jgi:hypothetical protein